MLDLASEEQLISNSSVIAHTLADKQLNLPIPNLSLSQEQQSPSSTSLPAFPEF